MANWVTPVEAKNVEDGKVYFLGKNLAAEEVCPQWYFHATDIKGKAVMSQKPGIASRFLGGEKLREILAKHPELKAIPVPADADKRWTRRKRLFKPTKSGD